MIRALRKLIQRPVSAGVFPGDIQGNILLGYNLAVSAPLFVRFGSSTGARAVLNDVLPMVTSARRWDTKPKSTLNIAFTYEGLGSLDLPAEVLASFPAVFREGMRARAEFLGDIGASDPSHWDDGFGTGATHALFEIQAADNAALDRVVTDLERLFEQFDTTIVSRQRGSRLPDRKEHFGFVDGVGQPAMQGTGDARRGQGQLDVFDHWLGLPIGEIFHGHIDADGHPSPGPSEPFTLNGTFLVWRKLHEDAAAFRTWTEGQAALLEMDEELLRAKLVGRWSDGSPLALAPERPDPAIGGDPERVNAFDYKDDPDGLRCPLGAHIRRTNPRLGLGFDDELSVRQRIIRRGMTYGPVLAPGAPDDGAERGIFFAAYMADIERQYEFIQAHWCNDGDGVNVGHDPDPFVGSHFDDRKFTIPGSPPKFVHPLVQTVVTKGGEYFWVPSMQSLALLASGPVNALASERGLRGNPRKRRKIVQESGRRTLASSPRTSPAERISGTLLGVALAPVAFTISLIRGAAPVHPYGTVYDAELEVHPDGPQLVEGTVLGTPCVHRATIRLSRGFALPRRTDDVRGLALCLPDAGGPGRRQDFLMATVKTKASGKEASLRTDRYETLFSSLLRLATPQGVVVIRAVSVQPMPPDTDVEQGEAAGLAYDLTIASPGGELSTVARLTLGPPRAAESGAAPAFNVAHDGGGITTLGALNVTRKIVYRASHRGRAARHRKG